MATIHTLVLAWLVAPGSVPVDTAHHCALSHDNTLVVQTEWLSRGAGDALPLVHPLPAMTQIEGAVPQRDAQGRVVGIETMDHDVVFSVRLAFPEAAPLGAVPLAIPRQPGVHRMTLDPSLVFEPAQALAMRPRLKRASTASVERSDIARADRRLFPTPKGSGLSRYTSTADLERAGGMAGQLRSAGTRRLRLLWWAAGFSVFIVGLAAALLHRFRQGAQIERADALLAEEIESLGHTRKDVGSGNGAV